MNKPGSQDAYVYALVAGSEVKLKLKDLEGARKDLDAAEAILDTFDSIETEVHAAFYRNNAGYYEVLTLAVPSLTQGEASPSHSPVQRQNCTDDLHPRPAPTPPASIAPRSSTWPASMLPSFHQLNHSR